MVKYILIAFLLMGCALNQPMCRHYALYNASVVCEKYPVRIALGFRHGNYHAQAQALVDDEWEFIRDTAFGINVSKKDAEFTVTEYMTLKEFTERYICTYSIEGQ
uniref:Uncharacterized protein n=1 Tax=viral metagenome TaxID=1070528 RepID=A0A6M3JX16_9ZZZZ